MGRGAIPASQTRSNSRIRGDMADESNAAVADEKVENQEAPTEDTSAATAPGGEADGSASHQKKPLTAPARRRFTSRWRRTLARSCGDRVCRSRSRGFTGGIFMGLSALGVGIAIAHLGTTGNAFVISRMFYPLGFIVVILGRSQLFTENTLYPVALVLTEPKAIWDNAAFVAHRYWPSNVLWSPGVCGAGRIDPCGCLRTWCRQWPVLVLRQLMSPRVRSSGAVWWVDGLSQHAAWLVSGSHSITGSVMDHMGTDVCCGPRKLRALHRNIGGDIDCGC